MLKFFFAELSWIVFFAESVTLKEVIDKVLNLKSFKVYLKDFFYSKYFPFYQVLTDWCRLEVLECFWPLYAVYCSYYWYAHHWRFCAERVGVCGWAIVLASLMCQPEIRSINKINNINKLFLFLIDLVLVLEMRCRTRGCVWLSNSLNQLDVPAWPLNNTIYIFLNYLNHSFHT